MIKRFITPMLAVAVIVLAGGLAACSQPPLPKDHFYRVLISPPQAGMAAKTAPRFKGGLEVARFAVEGITAKLPIVYSDAANPNEVMAYTYHMWTEAPEAMVSEQLVNYLRAAKIADTVVTPEARINAAYVVSGRIKRFERIIIGAASKGLVFLELGLRERKSNKLLYMNTYRAEIKASEDGVGGAVAALNKGVAQIFARFTADIADIADIAGK